MRSRKRRATAGLLFLLLSAPALAGCLDAVPTPRHVALDFLRDDRHTSLFIEIDYQDGAQPHPDALSLLRQRAEERLNKPEGITTQSRAFQSDKTQWSLDDLRAAERDQRDVRASGPQLALYVLYVRGEYSENPRVLGVHYGATSIAIFKDQLRGGSITDFTVRDVERAVLIHEFGHVLGLVNLGVPMQKDREDPDSRGHSTNSGSVMYHAVQTRDIFNLVGGAPPNQFDADDVADLRAAGGR